VEEEGTRGEQGPRREDEQRGADIERGAEDEQQREIAAARVIESGAEVGEADRPEEVRPGRERRLGGAGDQEERDLPESPDEAKESAGRLGAETGEEARQGEAAPARLLPERPAEEEPEDEEERQDHDDRTLWHTSGQLPGEAWGGTACQHVE